MARPDEEIQIYNLSMQPIGMKLFKELTDGDTWRIICVWIENDQGQTLLQQRSFKKILGAGLWTCAVEGTVEGDDTYEETARREVIEEIGLKDFELIPANQVMYKTAFGTRIAQGYRIFCNEHIDYFTPQIEEVEQLKWANKEEVIAAIKAGDPTYPINAPVWLEMFNFA